MSKSLYPGQIDTFAMPAPAQANDVSTPAYHAYEHERLRLQSL